MSASAPLLPFAPILQPYWSLNCGAWCNCRLGRVGTERGWHSLTGSSPCAVTVPRTLRRRSVRSSHTPARGPRLSHAPMGPANQASRPKRTAACSVNASPRMSSCRPITPWAGTEEHNTICHSLQPAKLFGKLEMRSTGRLNPLSDLLQHRRQGAMPRCPYRGSNHHGDFPLRSPHDQSNPTLKKNCFRSPMRQVLLLRPVHVARWSCRASGLALHG